MANTPTNRPGARPDFTTFAGLGVALICIMGGLLLEKGQVEDVKQVTAALIVLGGTLGAVMVSTPSANLKQALRRAHCVFFEERQNDGALIESLVHYSTIARRGGIVSLENEALAITDPRLRKGMLLAVDGVDTQEIRRMLELDIRLEEDRADAAAHVFEAAGGYAPTIGIIGAVLGLIQVMKHLENMSEVGKGIAVAFVATVYGVGLANLLLLPAATKIRLRSRAEAMSSELILEGVIAIAEGLNPKLIRIKLEGFLGKPVAEGGRGENARRAAA